MFYLGIDVSKAKLDCALLVGDTDIKHKSKKVANTPAGIAELFTWLSKRGVELAELYVAMKTADIYHEFAAFALHDAGIMVSIVNPSEIKSFGDSLGVHTKKDEVDSVLIARFGQVCKPTAWSAPSKEARTLKALLARQEEIRQDLEREQNCLEEMPANFATESVVQLMEDHITFLKGMLNDFQQEIDTHINQHPALKKDFELLQG